MNDVITVIAGHRLENVPALARTCKRFRRALKYTTSCRIVIYTEQEFRGYDRYPRDITEYMSFEFYINYHGAVSRVKTYDIYHQLYEYTHQAHFELEVSTCGKFCAGETARGVIRDLLARVSRRGYAREAVEYYRDEFDDKFWGSREAWVGFVKFKAAVRTLIEFAGL